MYKIIGADDREYGPISLEQLRQWQAQGRVDAKTRVQVAGETHWKTVADLPEFASTAPPPSIPKPIEPPPAAAYPAGLRPRTNGFAVAGLIIGIFSLLSCCCCAGLPFNLLGLTFSIIALAQINSRPETYSGKEMAIGGLITSGLSLLSGIGIQLLGIAFNWHEIAREF